MLGARSFALKPNELNQCIFNGVRVHDDRTLGETTWQTDQNIGVHIAWPNGTKPETPPDEVCIIPCSYLAALAPKNLEKFDQEAARAQIISTSFKIPVISVEQPGYGMHGAHARPMQLFEHAIRGTMIRSATQQLKAVELALRTTFGENYSPEALRTTWIGYSMACSAVADMVQVLPMAWSGATINNIYLIEAPNDQSRQLPELQKSVSSEFEADIVRRYLQDNHNSGLIQPFDHEQGTDFMTLNPERNDIQRVARRRAMLANTAYALLMRVGFGPRLQDTLVALSNQRPLVHLLRANGSSIARPDSFTHTAEQLEAHITNLTSALERDKPHRHSLWQSLPIVGSVADLLAKYHKAGD